METDTSIMECWVNEAPTKKDFDRVESMRFRTQFGRCTFYGNNSPFQSEAEKQAKLIKNPQKMVRRAKAVVQIYGTEPHTGYSSGNPISENPWTPFREGLRRLGFSEKNIQEIIRMPY